MPWEIFEAAAHRYESWYATPRGQRADHAERALLNNLFGLFPSARSVLEVGCGTGHFSEWLAQKGLTVFGLDRSPAMLADMHARVPTFPVILGDAHYLPVKSGAVDIVAFVTTLEFLEDPTAGLAEAVRVARQGVIMLVLNRWSLGGFSRRWGPQASQSLLSQAHDYSLWSLRALVQDVTGARLRQVQWASTLFPAVLWTVQGRVPLGEVIGMAAVLTSPTGDAPTNADRRAS